MLSLSVEDMLVLVVLWLVSGGFSAYIWMRLVVNRYVPRAIENMLTEPSPRTLEAVGGLLEIMFNSRVRTGKRITDSETGKEIEETKPFLLFVGLKLAKIIYSQMSAYAGGDASAAVKEMDGIPELSPLVRMAARVRRKDQGIFEFIIENVVASPKGQAVIQGFVEKQLNKLQPPPPTQ